MERYLLIAALILAAACLVLLILLLRRAARPDTARLTDAVADEVTQRASLALTALKSDLVNENRSSRMESAATVQSAMKSYSESQTTAINQQFRTFSEQNTAALEGIRATVREQLTALQTDNHRQLDQMRQTVDEKLQKTLNDRITQSFQLVNERLQEVYAGLGEMRTLASGVGDLKKVLSNVKTRGILGEYQLGAIIEELLAPEQYEENVATKPGSANRVEFAIRLPGEGEGQCIWLPIDAKFPGDSYTVLVDAYESGDPGAIAAAQNALEARIKAEARDIRDKYVAPPYTTDFGILFLPFEGLYAEVVRMGLVEPLQRQFRVNIAGPTTFAALLNSLQMGFRTLAIQKRSGEVWNVLGAVKTEFESFGSVLEAAQKRITQTSEELDKLVGVRTRQINRRLKDVTGLPAEDSRRLLGDGEDAAPGTDV
jgi:DNA recombination protein RmuC